MLVRSAAMAVSRNRQKGEDALALIARRLSAIAEAFYDIALALTVLRRKEVYSALGAVSFDALIEERTPISKSVAFELLKIPAHLSREVAVALGRDKSVALVRLVEATPEEDSAETLARTDAKIAGTPISKVSAIALHERASRVRKKRMAGKPTRHGEDEAVSAASKLETWLERVAKRDLRVVAFERDREWWVRTEIPIAVASRISKR